MRRRTAATQSDDLDQALTYLQDADGKRLHKVSHRDAFEGTIILGATGTGKSTGVGLQYASGLIADYYSGFVVAVKGDDIDAWANFNPARGKLGYVASRGRTPDDVIVIGPRFEEYDSLGLSYPAGGHRLNVLNAEFAYHERHDPLSATSNIAYLCCTATQAADESHASSEPFWAKAEHQMCLNAVDLAICATGGVSLANLAAIIRSAPRSRSEAWSATWRATSEFWNAYMLPAIARTPPGHVRHRCLEQAANYWLVERPELAEKTRSVIDTGFMSKVTPLLRGSLRSILAGDRPDTFDVGESHRGKIIIADLPVKTLGEPARFGQILLKTFWQRCTERRSLSETGARRTFLWLDEAQALVTRHDAVFAQTSRSQQVATVMMTQNISNFYAAIGGPDARAATDSLLGNQQTKIFLANGDAVTNEWAERHFAKELQFTESAGFTSESVLNRSQQESMQPVVPARDFTTLKKGGAENGGVVEAIVFQTGRRWDDTGANFARVQFQQGGLSRRPTR